MKRMWEFFLDDDEGISYCSLCTECDRDCKQSFRIVGIYCPYQESIRKERMKEKRRKVVI